MDIWEQVSRQRVKHILSSYRLDDGAMEEVSSPFNFYLEELFKTYALPLIELALAETLVDQWRNIPMERGLPFLQSAHNKLKGWESKSVINTLTPAQFQQITGLSAAPIFGSGEPSSSPSLRPS